MWKHWTTSSLSPSPQSLIMGTNFLALHTTTTTTTPLHSTPPVASILFIPFSLLKLLSEFFRPCINEPIAAHTKFRPTSEIGPEALRRISLTETHLKKPWHNSYFGMVSWDSSELRRSLYTILWIKWVFFFFFMGLCSFYSFTYYCRISFHMIWLWVFLGFSWGLIMSCI